ncbi:MAG: outer membrane beta-barrel protein [Pseudomonadota bacterium]
MKVIVTVALFSAFVAAPAVAADTGFYFGAKFGSVNYGYANVSNNSQAGYGLLGGYTVNDYFAVEAEFNRLGGFDSTTGTVKGRSFGFSGVGSLPLSPEFSLFGKMGISSSTLDDTAKPGYTENFTYTNTGLSIGFGGKFNIGNDAGILFGFDSYPVGDSAITTTSSAGMLYLGGIFKF